MNAKGTFDVRNKQALKVIHQEQKSINEEKYQQVNKMIKDNQSYFIKDPYIITSNIKDRGSKRVNSVVQQID